MRKMFMCLIVILTVAFQVDIAFCTCCVPPDTCIDGMGQTSCSALNGSWVSGSCTEPNICQFDHQTVPTMTEWGMIIFVVLAGLGAAYYLRKQKSIKIP